MGETTGAAGCHCIPYTEIPHVSRLFTDLLYHFDQVSSWYSHPPLSLDSYRNAARTLAYPDASRAEAATVLEEQARRFGAASEQLQNIERLRKGAYAIVTGQQVGLFGGPVFSFYKALTAIKIAAGLTTAGLDTVPVFWLATEDHDLEEVNHAWMLDREGRPRMVKTEVKPQFEHAPVGDIAFTAEISKLVEETIAMLPEGESSEETAALLRDCYRPGATLGSSFGAMMTRLFGRFGVILMDPRDARLRQLAAPVFRKAIESAADFYHALDARNHELSSHGYHNQVYVSEETSLLFVRVDGKRIPLRRAGGDFTLQGERTTREKLLADLDTHPEIFSPNVLLRPVVQDSLLPTLGYVGGPAELAYFAQAGAVYQGILGRMPVVTPRASFTLVDGHASKLLGRYGLTLPAVFAEDTALRERMAKKFLPPELTATLARSSAELDAMLGRVRRELGALDHTLDDAASRAGRKMTYQLSRLGEKAGRAVLRRDAQVDRDAVYLLNHLHPRHSLQERVYTGVSFLAIHGTSLLDTVYERVQTRTADHQPLSL